MTLNQTKICVFLVFWFHRSWWQYCFLPPFHILCCCFRWCLEEEKKSWNFKYLYLFKIAQINTYHISLWVAAKFNPQIFPRRVPDILYPIFCFQQAFWLNIRHSMSPLKNIYIFRRIFLHQKLKNRAKIEKSVKIKNWQMNFFGFFFSFFHQNDKEWPPWLPKWWKLIFVSL